MYYTANSCVSECFVQVKFDKIIPLLVQLLEKSNAVAPSQIDVEFMEVGKRSSTSAERKPFPLSPHEYLTMKLCIGAYTPKMASHLRTNSEEFQLLIKLIGAHSFDQYVSDPPSPQELAINKVMPCFVHIVLYTRKFW